MNLGWTDSFVTMKKTTMVVVDLNERRVWWICEFFGSGGGFMGFYGLLVVVGLVVVVAGL